MARLIEAVKCAEIISEKFNIPLADLVDVFAEIPAADVVEVKHAKWEINCDGYYPYCSKCKTEPKNGLMSKYCPECGAVMDGTPKERGGEK